MMHHAVSSPQGQIVRPLTGSFVPGYVVEVKGCAPFNSNIFSVNLQCGPIISPRDDVAIHIRTDFVGNRFILNSILSSTWGAEQVDGVPIRTGEPFVMIIRCTQDLYTIEINQRLYQFCHRLPISRVTHLAIDGDVNITQIRCIPPFFPQQPPIQPVIPQQPPIMPVIPQQPPIMPVIPQQQQQFPHAAPPYPMQGYQSAPPPYSAASASAPPAYHGHNHPHGKNKGLSRLGAAPAGTVYDTRALNPKAAKKAAKKQKKMAKKALKYGLPVAGVGLGAYAIGQHFGSSSSSSSSSDEE